MDSSILNVMFYISFYLFLTGFFFFSLKLVPKSLWHDLPALRQPLE